MIHWPLVPDKLCREIINMIGLWHFRSRILIWGNTKKLKGEIHCGSHLIVTFGGELLYLQIFCSYACQANVSCLSHRDLNMYAYYGMWLSYDYGRRLHRMIMPNPKIQKLTGLSTLMHWVWGLRLDTISHALTPSRQACKISRLNAKHPPKHVKSHASWKT